MLLEESRIILEPLGVCKPGKTGDCMVIWLDVSLDKVEALLEYDLEEVCVARTLLSHDCSIMEGKLAHC